MSDEIKNKLLIIKNPSSGKTLFEEGRVQNIVFENNTLTFEYKRDGISPKEKREIEDQIRLLLEKDSSIKEIFVKTSSEKSQDVFNSLSGQPSTPKKEEAAAQLKVGHGTVGNKKNVPGVGKVIAIGSGKGGVGKSTFTANLALSLSQQGFKVGVIDADIYGPSMPMIFGKREDKPRSNSEKKIIPIESYGIKLISFGFFINENDPVIWRGPMLGGVINQFLFDVDWKGIDYLLIDLPPGTGDIQLSMIQNSHVDGAIIISTPQDVALLDAKKGLEMFRKLNLPIIGMVENMSSFVCHGCGSEHFIFGESGVEKASIDLNEKILGKVPLELELRVGSDKGIPYMSQERYRERPVWKAFNEIAVKLVEFFEPTSPKVKSEGIMSKLFGLGK
jgi:ATP-binding protein involved in chromosome partitioning